MKKRGETMAFNHSSLVSAPDFSGVETLSELLGACSDRDLSEILAGLGIRTTDAELAFIQAQHDVLEILEGIEDDDE